MKRMPCCGVMCYLKFMRKKDHDSVDSNSTRAKAIGRILLLSSWVIAISSTPLYLPYKCVLSTDTNGLQHLNASIYGGKAQNTLSSWLQYLVGNNTPFPIEKIPFTEK
ncbi:hypothetical protein AAHE18_12G054100 [Arachis hypogaea]